VIQKGFTVNSSPSPLHQLTEPRVSVVIPTYNRSTLLPNAIDSVLRQSYTDYEIIVIDDGSTDDTRVRLQPYMESIRYFYQPNKGASAAQNAGIKVARGEWVSILASDDTWLPKKLESQFEALATLGDEFGACVTNCNIIGSPSTGLTAFEEAELRTDSVFGPLRNPSRYVLPKHWGIYVQSLLVLRSLVNQVDGFDEALGVAEDQDIIFKLSFKTKFCFVSTPLVNIDRTNGVQRLTRMYVRWDDRVYAWHVSPSERMLARSELVDGELRQTIQDELVDLYYAWACERISGFRLKVALQNINKIRRMGHSYWRIFCIVLARAWRKLSRPLRQRTTES
jgi:glycosyltransferase involved in cell wall biosynthesis